MTKQEAIQQQIDDIMDTFEFEKIHEWMTATDWKWAIGGNDGTLRSEVPSIYEIRRAARERLKEAASRKNGFSCTGGFTARRIDGEDNDGPWITMHLAFGYQSLNDGTTYTK